MIEPAPRPALRFWRSPAGQPWWARPALLTIAGWAAVLYGWNIRDSGYAPFYAVAVKSMSVSWQAFWYGALDPAATVTIDKLAGSFVPQALSARLFGYHPWSLTLPQVIEGVVAVLVMYRIGRRWHGPAAGLLAAGLFAATPITASMFGHPMEDGLLTMCLVLAADALQSALLQPRLRPLLAAAAWVGVGFQAKMLQAWMVLPALAVTYLAAAPVPLRRRIVHLVAAGGVLLAVSLSWLTLYAVTPAEHRPYIDGTTNNNAFAMVFGYNGIDRFGLHWPGAAPSMFTGEQPSTPTGPVGGRLPGPVPSGGSAGGDSDGWLKLLGRHYAAQIGWLYPAALLGLLLGLRRRGAPEPRSWYVFLGLWLTTFVAVYSRMDLPHTAYLASLAPPIALLTAAAVVTAWRGYRTGAVRWGLPALVAAEAAWTVYLSARFPTFLPWLTWLVATTAAATVLVLVVAALRPAAARIRAGRVTVVTAMTLAVAASIAVPAAWAASVLDRDYAGSAFDASAGPSIQRGPASVPPGPMAPAGAQRGQFGAGGPLAATDTLSPRQQRLYTYLRQHNAGARYLAATDSWSTAAPYIMSTGAPMLPMGGFSGNIPNPTLAATRQLVAAGELRYALLSGGGGLFGRPSGGSLDAITAWVRSACTAVPPEDYGAAEADPAGIPSPPAGFPAAPPGIGPPGDTGSLYQCAP